MNRDELLARLQDLFERDRYDVEKLQAEIERAHKAIPDIIEHTASLSGVEPMLLVKLAVRVAWNYDMKWYEVMSLLRSFYQYKMNLESEETNP